MLPPPPEHPPACSACCYRCRAEARPDSRRGLCLARTHCRCQPSPHCTGKRRDQGQGSGERPWKDQPLPLVMPLRPPGFTVLPSPAHRTGNFTVPLKHADAVDVAGVGGGSAAGFLWDAAGRLIPHKPRLARATLVGALGERQREGHGQDSGSRAAPSAGQGSRAAPLTSVLVQMELGSQPPLFPSLHSSISVQTCKQRDRNSHPGALPACSSAQERRRPLAPHMGTPRHRAHLLAGPCVVSPHARDGVAPIAAGTGLAAETGGCVDALGAGEAGVGMSALWHRDRERLHPPHHGAHHPRVSHQGPSLACGCSGARVLHADPSPGVCPPH